MGPGPRLAPCLRAAPSLERGGLGGGRDSLSEEGVTEAGAPEKVKSPENLRVGL